MALLDGITVLDLASVGPAARASRMLADYGARVIKVGPTSKKGSLQIQPAYHTYGAGRGLSRMRIDLKSDGGREAFLRLTEKADVVIESYRPGVVARLGIDYEAVARRNPGIVYCSTSGYGQHGPASAWAGHDINYLAMAGFLACSEPRADGGPPIPGATVADSAGGGMHAVIAILAALVKRAGTGQGEYLDVAALDGVLSLMSLSLDQYLATGEVAGPREGAAHGSLRVLRRLRVPGRALDFGRRHRAALLREPVPTARARAICGAAAHDDDAQDEIRQAFQERFRRAKPRMSGWTCWQRPIPAWRPCAPCPR